MVACLRCGEDNPHQARFCMHCATELPGSTASSHRVRKTVTVLFSDIVDSTRLGDQRDIELSNLVLSRFYDEARHVLEQYEGTVEKFIGDAVVGIFGVPSLHEDDALRAVRAAIELRTALVGLNGELERDHDVHVRIRTAVNTGAVVVTEGAAGRSQPTVLGDAIDVASRLQHEAEPDEILIGEATYRLVRDHVTAEPVQPLRLRGKGQPVTAWRLRSLEPPIRHRPRRFAAPMVGRDHDLDAVLAFFERATSQRSCHLVMVLGEAGVGKTRLVEELERRIEQRAAVRRGSCRPYGEGITFEPVAEIIRRAAGGEGNPLFTEEWIADLTEAGTLRLVDDRWLVTGDPAAVRATPPRIDAIVTTRLDRLMPEERAVVERAAVIGMPFRVAEVAALLTSAAKPVAATLMDLARKELLANEDATFRFRHTLIRDAAYQAIPKEHRALLHSSYANWLENTGGNYASHSAELIGRHLEAAHRYQTELGRHDDGTRALARRAGRHLAAAGHRGLRGRDVPASVAELLSSAVRLLAGNDAVRREALLDLADALRQSGARQRAIDVYNQALEVARAAADEVRATRAELGRLQVGYEREPERTLTEAPAVTSRGLEVFERAGDDLNLANTWRFRAFIDAAVGRSSAAREAAERAMALARRAGDERFEARVMRLYCFILDWGPTPVREVAERTRQALEWAQAQATREVEKDSLNILARAAAMGGDLEGARDLLGRVRSMKTDLSESLLSHWAIADDLTAASIELLDNRPMAAAWILLQGKGEPAEERIRRLDDVRRHPIVVGMLARAMLGLGWYQEAERLTRTCEEIAPASQLEAQIKWRELRAVALAHQGELPEAERLARAAVALAERSEQAESRAQAFADLAEVLQVAGRAGEVSAPLERALELYQAKGNRVMAERTRALLMSAAAQ